MLPVGGRPPAPTMGTPAPEPTPPLLTTCWTSVPKANKPWPEHWLPQSSPSPSPPLDPAQLDPGSIPPPPLRLPHLDACRVCPNAAFPKKFSEAQILSACCVPGRWACPRTGVRAHASCPKHDINLKALVLSLSPYQSVHNNFLTYCPVKVLDSPPKTDTEAAGICALPLEASATQGPPVSRGESPGCRLSSLIAVTSRPPASSHLGFESGLLLGPTRFPGS